MKIGIYGGTFDPPHKGHTLAASDAAGALGLDRLLVIPTAQPPHKELKAGSADAQQRLEMTRLAMAGVPCAEISDMEITRGGRSYTVDTLSQIRNIYPTDTVYLIMGTDMFLGIEKWYRFKDILSSCTLCALSREGDGADIERFAGYLEKTYSARCRVVKNRPFEVSSTQVREALPRRMGEEYLDENVYSFIVRHRLYGVKPSFDFLRRRAFAMLKPTRIPHVQGCEETAVMLARRWGADEEDAREAAILHDITKKLSLDEQLIMCERYGIIADKMEKQSANLLHSKTAAAIAAAEFGCSEAVCSAINYHTTGKEDMSLLEKIIYMADYVEPTRDFPGVERLRSLAFEDLDEAMLLGYAMSIEDMTRRGIVPHERTVLAMRWLELNKGQG